MMISQKVADRLNEQVKNEFFAYWTYLAMSFSADSMGLKVFSRWFDEQATEERSHAMKLTKYLLDQGVEVKLQNLPAPKNDYDDIQDIVKGALDHELKVTKQIHELVELAQTEHDIATAAFLQWFVDEQVEEVATVTELLSLTKMASGPGQMLMVEDRIMALRVAGGK